MGFQNGTFFFIWFLSFFHEKIWYLLMELGFPFDAFQIPCFRSLHGIARWQDDGVSKRFHSRLSACTCEWIQLATFRNVYGWSCRHVPCLWIYITFQGHFGFKESHIGLRLCRLLTLLLCLAGHGAAVLYNRVWPNAQRWLGWLWTRMTWRMLWRQGFIMLLAEVFKVHGHIY